MYSIKLNEEECRFSYSIDDRTGTPVLLVEDLNSDVCVKEAIGSVLRLCRQDIGTRFPTLVILKDDRGVYERIVFDDSLSLFDFQSLSRDGSSERRIDSALRAITQQSLK